MADRRLKLQRSSERINEVNKMAINEEILRASSKNAEYIVKLKTENERLKLELAKLIDLLKLPSLFPMLSQLEKESIKYSEQALKGKEDG